MRLLFIGDVYGRPGRRAVCEMVPGLREEFAVDVCIANVENAAGGRGLNRKAATQLFDAGVDLMTTGNHGFDNPEIFEFIDHDHRIVRACNTLPPNAPGRPFTVLDLGGRGLFGLVGANGCVFMEERPSPFAAIEPVLRQLHDEGCRAILVDFHAEATSEKAAFGWHLAGRVSAVVGTHTHVQTADETLLEGVTAFITDVGMTGPYDSVIGARKDRILRRFVANERASIVVATGDVKLCAVVIDVDASTGRATAIQRLRRDLAPEA